MYSTLIANPPTDNDDNDDNDRRVTIPADVTVPIGFVAVVVTASSQMCRTHGH